MSEKVDKIFISYEEKNNMCEECGEEAETRPYGVNGTEICMKCMKSLPEREERAMRKFKEQII